MKSTWFFAFLCLSGNTWALDVSDTSRFVCKQGNCVNGSGVVWDAYLNVRMQGNWVNGKTVPGATYVLAHPLAPGKQYKQIYGQDGLLESGDMPRPLGSFGTVIPVFTGTYGQVQHAFLRMPLAVPRRGVYDTGNGIEYRGRFEYLSAKSGMNTNIASGYFIFYGDRVDTEENETETGLFISDETMAGAGIRFVKAEPSYLAVLQQKYQRDMGLAQVEFKDQESAKAWRAAFGVIGKVAYTVATGGVGGLSGNNGGIAGDVAMNLVSGMFNKGGGGMNVKQLALEAVGSAVTGDQDLGRTLGRAVSEGIDEAGTK